MAPKQRPGWVYKRRKIIRASQAILPVGCKRTPEEKKSKSGFKYFSNPVAKREQDGETTDCTDTPKSSVGASPLETKVQ